MKESAVRRKTLLTDISAVNNETGEAFETDENSKLYHVVNTGLFKITYEEFVCITPKAIMYLNQNCKKSDIAKVLSMSATIREKYCVLFTNNHKPHNIKSLARHLKIVENEVYRLKDRLIELNIIYYGHFPDTGHNGKIFMFNPYIAKKANLISENIKKIFRNVTKEAKGP
jgi:hypothetical protein